MIVNTKATYLYQSNYTSPLGEMLVMAVNEGICLLEFVDRIHFDKQVAKVHSYFKASVKTEEHPHIIQLKKELDLYFSKQLKTFSIPLFFTGTDFQIKVYHSLLKIDYGTTSTYKEQAILLGNLKAIRAVATANGSNKLAIIVPCHRIIGSSNDLIGYAGGIDRKKTLLDIEGVFDTLQTKLF